MTHHTMAPAFALLALITVAAHPASAKEVLKLAAGPHLFLDDYLVESSDGVTRRVVPPERDLDRPLITGEEDGCFQPYMTMLRDEKSGRFRAWYNL